LHPDHYIRTKIPFPENFSLANFLLSTIDGKQKLPKKAQDIKINQKDIFQFVKSSSPEKKDSD